MKNRLAIALAASLSLASCSSAIHVGGEYRPVRAREGGGEKQRLLDRSRVTFIFGWVDFDGPADVEAALARAVPEGSRVLDLEVQDSQTILGIVLDFFTLGLVGQRHTTARARIVPTEPAAGP